MRQPAMTRYLWMVAALMGSLTLSGCNNDDLTDLRQFIEQTRVKYQGQVEPLPVIVPYESYRYSVANLRDPFRNRRQVVRSTTRRSTDTGLTPNTRRNREELERYSLDTLSMAGVLENNGETWAIVKAPDGGIYKVKRGNYIGQNFGQITRITDSGISISEIVRDSSGNWVRRKNKLSLNN